MKFSVLSSNKSNSFQPKELDIICFSSFSLYADAEPHGSAAVQPEASQDERSSVPGYGHVCQLAG